MSLTSGHLTFDVSGRTLEEIRGKVENELDIFMGSPTPAYVLRIVGKTVDISSLDTTDLWISHYHAHVAVVL